MPSCEYTLGAVGAGKMGSALIRALTDRGALKAEQVIAVDALPQALEKLASQCPGVEVTDSIARVAACARVLLVAVKPQDSEAVLQAVAPARRADGLVLSIMAGVKIARIAALVGEDVPIIRVMPNVCCEVAQGAFGYAANEHVTTGQKGLVHDWLNLAGAAEELREPLLDAVTGLSGSGPAFVAVFLEALTDGGVAAGLPRQVAQRLAAQTVLGSAEWVLRCGGPAVLKDMVCSPAGTTAAGLRELEAGGLRSAAIEAVVAAAERSRELGA